MITTFLRTLILYILVLFSVRCIGKAGLSSSDPFQIVMMLMIAEIASIPVESPDTSLFNGISAIFMILFLYALSGFLTGKSEKLKVIINGKPSILIDNGAINFDELKKSNITLTDLAEMLRLKDAASITDVLYAYLETNGEFSVILKPEKSPITREDMNINASFNNMPCIIVSDGVLYPDNLKKVGIDENYLHNSMKKIKIKDLKQILLCFCDDAGKLYFYKKSDSKLISPICTDSINKSALEN